MAALDLSAPPNVERLSMVHKELVEMSILLKAKAEDLAKREVALHLREQTLGDHIDEYAHETSERMEKKLQKTLESQLRRLEAARSRFQAVVEASRSVQVQKDERIQILEAENEALTAKVASQKQRLSAVQKKLRVLRWQSSETRQKVMRTSAEMLMKLEREPSPKRKAGGSKTGHLATKSTKEVIELLYALLEALGATVTPAVQSSRVHEALVEEPNRLTQILPGLCLLLDPDFHENANTRSVPQQRAVLRLLLTIVQLPRQDGGEREKTNCREGTVLSADELQKGEPTIRRKYNSTLPRRSVVQQLSPFLAQVPAFVGAGKRGDASLVQSSGLAMPTSIDYRKADAQARKVGGLLASKAFDVSVMAAVLVLCLSRCIGQRGAAMAALRVQAQRAEGRQAILAPSCGMLAISCLVDVSKSLGGRISALACGALLNLSEDDPHSAPFHSLLVRAPSGFTNAVYRILCLKNVDNAYAAIPANGKSTTQPKIEDRSSEVGEDSAISLALAHWAGGDPLDEKAYTRSSEYELVSASTVSSILDICTAYGVLLQRSTRNSENALELLATSPALVTHLAHLCRALSVHISGARRAGVSQSKQVEGATFLLRNLRSAQRALIAAREVRGSSIK